MTSNGRQPQNFKCWILQQQLFGWFSRPQMEDSLKILKFEYLRIGNHCSDLPQWKKTSNWRRPSMEEDLQWNTTSNGGRPLIEILSWISQQPFIGSSSNLKLNLRGPHQNLKCMIWRRPQLEDDLKILKSEYLRISDHWSDLPQWKKISNWRRHSMEEDLQRNITSNGRRHIMEDDLKFWNLNMSATIDWIFLKS